MVLAAILKIGLSWHLTAIPWLGEVGAAWATNADLAAATILNLFFAYRYARYVLDFNYIVRLFLASVVTAAAARLLYAATAGLWGNTLATCTAILVALIVYIVAIFLFRAMALEDIRQLPVLGSKLYGLLIRKIH
jgi:stage V sporulation protein B